jgi:hypothetical protein
MRRNTTKDSYPQPNPQTGRYFLLFQENLLRYTQAGELYEKAPTTQTNKAGTK